MRWAAAHYVAPLPVLLGKGAPPNLPRRRVEVALPAVADTGFSPLPDVSAAAAAGEHLGARYLLGPASWAEHLAGLAAPVLDAGRSVMVVVPSVAEAGRLSEGLAGRFGARVVMAAGEEGGGALTAAWEAGQQVGRLLVGTREVALWPMAGLALAVVVDEGRRGLKDRATPTTHARDLLWRRSAVERFPLVLCGAVPTTEALHRAPVLLRLGGRPWGLVEAVDRSAEAPGGGLIGDRGRQALRGCGLGRRPGLPAGGDPLPGTALCDLPHSASLPAVRGPARLRRLVPSLPPGAGACPRCGGRRFEALGAAVSRLVAEAGGFLSRDLVGEGGSGRPVVVGTERDLAGLGPVDLGVVVDADGLLRAPHYRAVEDGLRLMARVAGGGRRRAGEEGPGTDGGSGASPLTALRRGDPLPLLEAEMVGRTAVGFPPAGEIIVVEAAGAPEGADAALRETVAGRAEVHGPADRAGRARWLLQGRDLQGPRLMLRRLVQDWRDAGARVRVDADPIDL